MHVRPAWFSTECKATTYLTMVHRKILQHAIFEKLFRYPMQKWKQFGTAIKYLLQESWFKSLLNWFGLEPCIHDDFVLHENSEKMGLKSDIMTLPVLMKDEKKYSDCVDVLDQLEQWTEDVCKASGKYNFDKSLSTVSHPIVQVPTHPDQPRSHIPPIGSQTDPLEGVKIPCFGDELIRVRFAGARDLRSGCHTPKQRLDHLYPYRIVGWHAKRSFLKVNFKISGYGK